MAIYHGNRRLRRSNSNKSSCDSVHSIPKPKDANVMHSPEMSSSVSLSKTKNYAGA